MERVLGADLFAELGALGAEFDHQECDAFTDVPEHDLARIADQDYLIALPFTGDAILRLVSALHHASEADCDNCHDLLAEFTGTFLAAMWTTVLFDGGDDE